MKKAVLILSCFIYVLVATSCTSGYKQQADARVSDAIEVIAEYWDDEYTKNDIEDKYLKIVNARIINIKENNEKAFEDIDYIVEFVLFSNYFNSSPYYQNIGMYDSVVVYKDGRKEVARQNQFNLYRAKNYSSDFSEFIESIEDFNEQYNHIVEIK